MVCLLHVFDAEKQVEIATRGIAIHPKEVVPREVYVPGHHLTVFSVWSTTIGVVGNGYQVPAREIPHSRETGTC